MPSPETSPGKDVSAPVDIWVGGRDPAGRRSTRRRSRGAFRAAPTPHQTDDRAGSNRSRRRESRSHMLAPMPGPSRVRIGADVGGTFTDVVLQSATRARCGCVKVLSTPPAYDRAVVDAVRELLGADDVVAEVVHGTTVATNAVLEKLGARTAIVTTLGFRDVLELRRMRMPHLYDYFWTKPTAARPAPAAVRGRRADVGLRVRSCAPSRPRRRVRVARGASRRPTWNRLPSACCTPISTRSTSGCWERCCAPSSRTCRSRSRPRSCASSRSTSAPRRRP